MFFRKPDCDIRIQLPNVSQEHAVVEVEDDKKVGLYQLSQGKKVLKNAWRYMFKFWPLLVGFGESIKP